MGAVASGISAATISQPAHYMTRKEMPSAPTLTPGGSYVDEKLLTAKLEAVEARTETKFAQLLGKLELLAAKIEPLSGEITEAKNAASATRSVIIGTGITLGGLIIGLFAFGWQIMDLAAGIFQAGGTR